MKKLKQYLMLLSITGVLSVSSPATYWTAQPAAAEIESEAQTNAPEQPSGETPDQQQEQPSGEVTDPQPEKPAVLKGWVTRGTRTKYYLKGKQVTGKKRINGIYYLFSSKGNLQKNRWVRIDGQKYRADAKGQMVRNRLIRVDGNYYFMRANGTALTSSWKTFSAGKSYFDARGVRATGAKKIAGQYYYFNKRGYLQTGKTLVKAGKETYYLDGNGMVEMKKSGSGSSASYYSGDGKKMDSVQVNDYETLQRAKGIVSEITRPSMSKSEKLTECFRWVIKRYYKTRRPFSNFRGWPAVFANDHFLYGCGNCHSDAAAFAYLAKAVGYTNVYVCTDATGSHGEGHSWAEIDGKVYDPLFAEAKGHWEIYYGGSYSAYRLHPVLHIKI